MSQPKLTQHLLSQHTTPPLSAAVYSHPFLAAARRGTLSRGLLALWLAQDRLYAAHAYPRFVGALIARIPYARTDAPGGAAEEGHARVLGLLVRALENIVREVGFFGDVARRWGLEVAGWGERKGTRDYTAEMARVAGGAPVEDGLVFLWAMEKEVYLDAWTAVHEGLAATGVEDSAVHEFARNWSSDVFVQFVDELAELVDGLGIGPGTAEWGRAEDMWRRVVELEEGFWPVAGEEVIMRE